MFVSSDVVGGSTYVKDALAAADACVANWAVFVGVKVGLREVLPIHLVPVLDVLFMLRVLFVVHLRLGMAQV